MNDWRFLGRVLNQSHQTRFVDTRSSQQVSENRHGMPTRIVGQMSKDWFFLWPNISLTLAFGYLTSCLLGALYPPPQVKSAQTLIVVILLFFAHVDMHRPLDIYFSNPCRARSSTTASRYPDSQNPKNLSGTASDPGNRSRLVYGSPGLIET